MYRHLISRIPVRLCAAVACGTVVYHNFTSIELKPLQAAGINTSRKYYPASAEYPDLTKNRSIMARHMTKQLYAQLRDQFTPNGFTIDDAIQTGVDNVGKFSFTGIVAGDEQSYKAFKPIFDKVIQEKHNFAPEQKHMTDLDASKLAGVSFDPDFVVSLRLRTIRNVRGFCLPAFCTRGERRDVETMLAKALYALDVKYNGQYYSIKDLSDEESKTLEAQNVFMDRPSYPTDISSRFERDWPDARGLWLSDDKSLVAHVNRRDHILLSVVVKDGEIGKAFGRLVDYVKEFEAELAKQNMSVMHNDHLGYITSDPKNLGTALKLSARIKLPRLSRDGRLSTLLKMNGLSMSTRMVAEVQQVSEVDEVVDAENSIVEVTSVTSLGKSEVQVAAEFVDAVNKIIEAECMLQDGRDFNELIKKK